MMNEQKMIAKYYFLLYEIGEITFDEARRRYKKWCDKEELKLL